MRTLAQVQPGGGLQCSLERTLILVQTQVSQRALPCTLILLGVWFQNQRAALRRPVARSQVLTEEYSEHGVHVANIIIDGLIDSPGTRALPVAQRRPEIIMSPAAIADAYWSVRPRARPSVRLSVCPSVHLSVG